MQFLHEHFGHQKTSLGRPTGALPTPPSVGVPVRPSGPVPLPDLIRTSTARPKPTNAAVPVARRANEQVEVGEPLLVAADRERLATVATIRAVNAELADKFHNARAPIDVKVGRGPNGDPQGVKVHYPLPKEVTRWKPDGVAINAELTADELSGDWRNQSDRMVNVCVSGPTPFLKATRERVGTRVYLLLIREAGIRFVPLDDSTGLTVSTDTDVVEWLERRPRRPTDAICEDVGEIFGKLSKNARKAWRAAATKSAWKASGGWWGVEKVGYQYRFVLETTLQISLGEDVPDNTLPDVCCVVRAWPFGRILDNNAKLKGEQASTLHVCIGAPIFEHDTFSRHVGDPARGVYSTRQAATVLDQIRA